MNHKKLILLTIPVLLISCGNINENKKPDKDSNMLESKTLETIKDSNVYDDIDLYNLRGIREIKHPLNYPYIKIEDKGNLEKKIVYKITDKDSTERNYKLENNYWTSTYEYETDTGSARIIDYIRPEKIIELDYQGTYKKTDYRLHNVSIIENNKKIAYSYFGEKGIDIAPKPENFELVKKNANAIYNTVFSNKNGILYVISNSFDKKEKRIFHSDTSCYQTNNRSWFWWHKFGWNSKIKCN